jgi:glycosyltransferase involved in cell wall biosynthesis
VIIPARNEARYIVRCLTAVFDQDYPSDNLEVVVVDGCSSDETRDLVREFASAHPALTILTNSPGTIPHALNLGIRATRGPIIVRVDAHTIIRQDYISQCVRLLAATGADVVGGPACNRGDTFWGEVIGRAMASRFGRPARFHRATGPENVDTVYMGAFRRDTLEQVGLFNESVHINEDYELNYRIRKAGGRVYASSAIRSDYYNRPTLDALRLQFWNYGRWKGRVVRMHPASLQPRHLVAPLFVIALGVGAVLAALGYPAPLATLLVLYGGVCVAVSWHTARGAGIRVAATALVFLTMHLCWGAGVLSGLADPSASKT